MNLSNEKDSEYSSDDRRKRRPFRVIRRMFRGGTKAIRNYNVFKGSSGTVDIGSKVNPNDVDHLSRSLSHESVFAPETSTKSSGTIPKPIVIPKGNTLDQSEDKKDAPVGKSLPVLLTTRQDEHTNDKNDQSLSTLWHGTTYLSTSAPSIVSPLAEANRSTEKINLNKNYQTFNDSPKSIKKDLSNDVLILAEMEEAIDKVDLLNTSAARDRIAIRPKTRPRKNYHNLPGKETYKENASKRPPENSNKEDSNDDLFHFDSKKNIKTIKATTGQQYPDTSKSNRDPSPRSSQRRHSEQSNKSLEFVPPEASVKKSHSFKTRILVPSLEDVTNAKLRRPTDRSNVTPTPTEEKKNLITPLEKPQLSPSNKTPLSPSKKDTSPKKTGTDVASKAPNDVIKPASPDTPTLSVFKRTDFDTATFKSEPPFKPPILKKKIGSPVSDSSTSNNDKFKLNLEKKVEDVESKNFGSSQVVNEDILKEETKKVSDAKTPNHFNIKLKKTQLKKELQDKDSNENDSGSAKHDEVTQKKPVFSEKPEHNQAVVHSTKLPSLDQSKHSLNELPTKKNPISVKWKKTQPDKEVKAIDTNLEHPSNSSVKKLKKKVEISKKTLTDKARLRKETPDNSDQTSGGTAAELVSHPEVLSKDISVQSAKKIDQKKEQDFFSADTTKNKIENSSDGIINVSSTTNPWQHVLRPNKVNNKKMDSLLSLENNQTNFGNSASVAQELKKPVEKQTTSKKIATDKVSMKISESSNSQIGDANSGDNDNSTNVFAVKLRKVDLNHSEKLKQVENDTAKAKLPNLNNNNVSYNQSKTVNLKPSHQSPDNSDTSLQEEPSDKNNRTAGSQVQHPEKKTDADPSWLSLARNRSERFKNRSENRLEIYEQTPAPDKNNKPKNESRTTEVGETKRDKNLQSVLRTVSWRQPKTTASPKSVSKTKSLDEPAADASDKKKSNPSTSESKLPTSGTPSWMEIARNKQQRWSQYETT